MTRLGQDTTPTSLEDVPASSAQNGFPANPPEKPGFVLEVSEPFDGSTLNLSRWLPYYLPHWSSRAMTAARYTLPGRGLHLQIEADQQPWNKAFDGDLRVSSLQTGCFAGSLGSSVGQHRFQPGLTVTEEQPRLSLWTPRYGYFETRLKAVAIPGYMVALWMIGFEEHPEQSAEVCICEIFGHQISDEFSTVGYGVHPFGDPSIRDEFYQDAMPINAAQHHVYAVDWQPDRLDFYVDNRHTRRIEQSPSYAMQFMLNIYELPSLLTPASAGTPFPKTLEVDYVRSYRRV